MTLTSQMDEQGFHRPMFLGFITREEADFLESAGFETTDKSHAKTYDLLAEMMFWCSFCGSGVGTRCRVWNGRDEFTTHTKDPELNEQLGNRYYQRYVHKSRRDKLDRVLSLPRYE